MYVELFLLFETCFFCSYIFVYKIHFLKVITNCLLVINKDVNRLFKPFVQTVPN